MREWKEDNRKGIREEKIERKYPTEAGWFMPSRGAFRLNICIYMYRCEDVIIYVYKIWVKFVHERKNKRDSGIIKGTLIRINKTLLLDCGVAFGR